MKKRLLLAILIMSSISLMAEDINILLSTEKKDISSSGERSNYDSPSAAINNTALTILYPLATESQVILIDQSTQTTVYSKTFAASRSVIIDLAEEGLEEGIYELHVYAFGKWWRGEFEIEEY